jgi:5-methylcytosine-specific restriction endonuclease McrA
MPTKPRKALTPSQRRIIARKTGRTCHVCGKRLDGDWQADHVRPYHLGGHCREDNYLPSCVPCNRLRWMYDSRRIRKILRLGVYLLKEIAKRTELGIAAEKKYESRLRATRSRRV